MVAGCGIDNRLLKRVAEIYDWLDAQVRRCSDLAGVCKSCGNCCDFGDFDHRLFVTPPELMYFTANLGAEDVKGSRFAGRRKMGPKPMPTGQCPYNVGGKCRVYEYRFAGCRIFCCNADADFQSELSESVLEKLKALCVEFRVPYRYTALADALNGLAEV